jgi:hypothetical protein
MYLFGQQESGQESIIEYNYFEGDYGLGAAIHLYGGSNIIRYYIARYNIINNAVGKSPFWGIALWGHNCTIVGNTVYGGCKGMEIGESHPENDFNVVENNIFYQWASVGVAFGSGLIQNLTLKNNLVYSTVPGNLTPYYQFGPGCVVSANITHTGPSFVQRNPTNWPDFRLQSGSPCVNAGDNSIGSAYQNGLDPTSTAWPPSTLNQNNYGRGYEIGAFVYRRK